VAQAARRLPLTLDALPLTLDALDARERPVAANFDFLRFGRNSNRAAGGDCSGATAADSGRSVGGDGRVVTEACGSRLLFTSPRPKASLNIAPYQSITALQPVSRVGASASKHSLRGTTHGVPISWHLLLAR
jgi:hypothetical protein